jgi:Prp8 binding protein
LRIGEEENKLMMELTGHVDSITGLALSPDEHHLLSNAMDNHLFSWDIRPFVLDPTNRCEKEYHGVVHSNEKNLLRCSWSCDQEFIACGSSDRYDIIQFFIFSHMYHYHTVLQNSKNLEFYDHRITLLSSRPQGIC